MITQMGNYRGQTSKKKSIDILSTEQARDKSHHPKLTSVYLEAAKKLVTWYPKLA